MSPVVVESRRPEYQKHHVFDPPPDDAVLSRYISLAQYLDLLGGTLFFPRADTLGDPLEGSVPRNFYQKLDSDLEAERASWPLGPAHFDEKATAFRAGVGGWHRMMRVCVAVSCWHEGPRESAALWQVHSKDSGICVRSSPRRVKSALIGTAKDAPVIPYSIGRVKYLDYETGEIVRGNVLWPLIHKRLEFAHEAEVRIAAIDMSQVNPDDPESVAIGGGGLRFKVDVDALVDHVLLSPASPDWFASAVESVTRRLGYGFAVRQSQMGTEPIF